MSFSAKFPAYHLGLRPDSLCGTDLLLHDAIYSFT